MTRRHSFDPEQGFLMNLFEHTPTTDDAPKSMQRGTFSDGTSDLELLHKLLEIFDQGQIAETLNEVRRKH